MKRHKLTDISSFHKKPLALAVLVALQGVTFPEAFADGLPPSGGPEFLVNTITAGKQVAPAMAMDAAGDFVVAWLSTVTATSLNYRVYARRYDKNENALDPTEFLVNPTTDPNNDQFAPAVAMDTNGNFVVAWHSGAGSGISAKLYNKDGGIVKDEFLVNTTTQYHYLNPAVAMDAAGDFVVAWESKGQDGDGYGIYAQRYNAAGEPQESGAPPQFEFKVNTTTTHDQINPAVAMDASGNFVVVWLNEVEAGSYRIYAQFYDAGGNSHGPELQVNASSLINGYNSPAVAMDANGNFVVAWEGYPSAIYARLYTFTNGLPQAQDPEFLVTSSANASPAVAMDAAGNFMVAWGRLIGGGESWDIYAQRYDKNGKALNKESEFRVNTYPAAVITANSHGYNPSAAVAMNSPSNFKIAWQSYDGDKGGIAGQRYALACHNAAFKKPVISNQYTDITYTPPGAPHGIFSFTAKFCNNGAVPLSNLVSRTFTIDPLTVGLSNHLLNRHYGQPITPTNPGKELPCPPPYSTSTPSGDGTSPSSIGSVLDFPIIDDYSDQVLAAGECVCVFYQIGLEQRKRFSFFVDIYGDNANLPGSSVTGTPCDNSDP